MYTTFPECQRLRYTCAAGGGSGSLQALHLALREALPHLGHLEALEVEVEQQHEEVVDEQEDEQEVDLDALLFLMRKERNKQEVEEEHSSTW
jgi:hypothetical protein